MTTTKKGMSKTGVAAVGVGAAVAAVGAYWFYGAKDAAKNRKAARSWMLKARAEVLEAVETAVEKAGEVDKETYLTIVKNVLARYSKLAGVTSGEMAQMTRDMKSAWQRMQKVRKNSDVKKVTKSVKKVAKKKVKRTR
jgi:hypothetical protein